MRPRNIHEEEREKKRTPYAMLVLCFFRLLFISLEMVCDGPFCFVCFVVFFSVGSCCFLLNASFTTDMVCVQIENKIMARRYSIQNTQTQHDC